MKLKLCGASNIENDINEYYAIIVYTLIKKNNIFYII